MYFIVYSTESKNRDMRLTESDDLTELAGKPRMYIDLVDGMSLCGKLPETDDCDSSLNIELRHRNGYVIKIVVHYKRLECTEPLGNLLLELQYHRIVDLNDVQIRGYLADVYGYYEFLSKSYKVESANKIVSVPGRKMYYEIINRHFPF